jgi:hypothetical protein
MRRKKSVQGCMAGSERIQSNHFIKGHFMITRLIASLAVLSSLAACATPADLDLSRTRPTEAGRYQVQLAPLSEPLPINKLHAWDIRLTTAAGQPVEHAKIEIDGGMPQHGHGLPTKPRVTRESGDGHYLLEGMKFSMTGWWEIKLNVHSAQGDDKVTFNVIASAPGAKAP